MKFKIHRIQSLAIWLLIGFLSLLTVKWLFYGFDYLLSFDNKTLDLWIHSTEQHYVFRGINPYVMAKQHSLSYTTTLKYYPPEGGRVGAAYFPWSRSIIIGGLLYFLRWPEVRYYFAFLYLIAIGAIFAWTYSLSKEYSHKTQILLCLSFTACTALFSNLWLGQTTLIISGFLVAAFFCHQRRYTISTGIFLALSFLKPTLSAFFLPALFIKKGRGAVLVAIGYLAIATIEALIRTDTDLLTWLTLSLESGSSLKTSGYSLLSVASPAFISIGLNPKYGVLLIAILTGLGAIILMWSFRHEPLEVHFAIAAIANRLGTYHHPYDNLIILFLLIPLGVMACRTNERIAIVGFFLVGLSLWYPVKWSHVALYQNFQMLAWVVGLVIFLSQINRSKPLQQHKSIINLTD